MSAKLRNAKSLPEVYFGLHMVEGIAEYNEPGAQPYRILVGETAIKNMNPTFQGKPVYVDHVDEVNLENLQHEADGYVMESFYNQNDGKSWVKFIVVSDEAKRRIREGWVLSNAYIPTGFTNGGEWHGAEYAKEVTGGEYEHLAIVKNPRYQESKILTPEQFKVYNGEKELELKRLANSKDEGESKMAFKLFKRTKVENSIDLVGMVVELPKSKIEMPLEQVINELDAIKNMHGYANGDHLVKVGDKDEMSVNDLVKKHMDMCNEMEALKAPKENKAIDENQDGDVGDRGGDESLENEESAEAEAAPLENEEDAEKKEKEKEEKMKNAANAEAAAVAAKAAKAKATALRNAGPELEDEEPATVELMADQVARGRSRYGSSN